MMKIFINFGEISHFKGHGSKTRGQNVGGSTNPKKSPCFNKISMFADKSPIFSFNRRWLHFFVDISAINLYLKKKSPKIPHRPPRTLLWTSGRPATQHT